MSHKTTYGYQHVIRERPNGQWQYGINGPSGLTVWNAKLFGTEVEAAQAGRDAVAATLANLGITDAA